LDGKHEDAEMFRREASRLLDSVRQRWSSPNAKIPVRRGWRTDCTCSG
jgi:hypothetical protein